MSDITGSTIWSMLFRYTHVIMLLYEVQGVHVVSAFAPPRFVQARTALVNATYFWTDLGILTRYISSIEFC
jgi:hypothetical protein